MSLNLGLGIAINSIRSLFNLISHYWVDHSGNNLTDHNGNKIIFIKRGPFINSFLYYSWKDNSNNILTNHDGNKIIFKKRSP